MTSPELAELYGDLVLDHGKSPRNHRVLEEANREARGFNPLCGDEVHLYLKLAADRIQEVGFQGNGCAISRASASLMTQAILSKTEPEARRLIEQMHRLLTEGPEAVGDLEALGKLGALSGVWHFPGRVKCASLAWYTLRAALDLRLGPVTTE